MIQVLMDSQWRWLNGWKNRAISGIDALGLEIESSGRKFERQPAINHLLLFPGGYIVELDTDSSNAADRSHDERPTSAP